MSALYATKQAIKAHIQPSAIITYLPPPPPPPPPPPSPPLDPEPEGEGESEPQVPLTISQDSLSADKAEIRTKTGPNLISVDKSETGTIVIRLNREHDNYSSFRFLKDINSR